MQVNREYLDHDTYTDIITFDYVEGDVISGDILISIDRVGENAKNFGCTFEQELHRVIIHGVLHLLGIQIPQLTYNGNDLANVVLQCKTNGHKAEIQGQGSLYNDDTHIAATLQATAKEDKLSIGALWQSNPADFFTGAFSTDVFFARNFIGNLETTIQSDSSHTTINKSLWELHPFVAHIAPKHTTIKDFRFEHDATLVVVF